ncbi:MAG: UDP-glucose 6-dehydrogenase [Deltaproteobacteria bacterium RIFCSPHIGHO2_02_FULL_40_11]|nr:MAG: UDP-glucose 6-dehydrogenase [Deltaproteobacteria bacterium RIFCSPHIGHO2_02_FULL_40_11]
MEIAVIGTGYVGLVAGTCFSETGNHVTCVDTNAAKISVLQKGHVPFYEPGLEDLIHRNAKKERLHFTTDTATAIQEASIIFIAVGTPQGENGASDLKYVLNVAETIGKNLNEHKFIVLKSTVPIGTHQKVKEIIQKNTNQSFDIVSNPEFLKEGSAIDDFLRPERVVIGTSSSKAIEVMKELYEPFTRSGNPILVTDNMSAELSKYACNSFLATKISFMNEMANLCEKVGANILDVKKAMTTDSRIGTKFLYPGVGYGGSCFPKDVQALLATSKNLNMPLKIVEATEKVNEAQKELLFQKSKTYFKGDLKGKTAAIWGLAFKPNTDDMREAPSLNIIRSLLDHGVIIKVYDPVAQNTAKHIFEDRLLYHENEYNCAKDADMLFILTEWNEFRNPDFKKLKKLLKQPVIFDGRNLFHPAQLKKEGFYYEGIGLK